MILCPAKIAGRLLEEAIGIRKNESLSPSKSNGANGYIYGLPKDLTLQSSVQNNNPQAMIPTMPNTVANMIKI